MTVETVVFKGIKFRRYPNAKMRTHRVYFTTAANHRARGVGALHQEIWKEKYGKIPSGFHIHHKDENPLNNAVENLEAKPGNDHLAEHAAKIPRAELLRRLRKARKVAPEWHRSKQGRKWHKRHFKTTLRKAFKRRRYVCQNCGDKFTSRAPQGARFCHLNCRMADLRRRRKLACATPSKC
jgi:rubrerythrin